MSTLPNLDKVSNEPLYNIGVVSRMTSISMATLRAWERRYDFPESQRTTGGHRLYSERDILRLRWVKQRVDEGMQTAQSIQALRHQEQTGHIVLTEQLLPATAAPIIPSSDGFKVISRDEQRSYLAVLQDRLMKSLIERNTQQADLILADALAGYAPEDLILNVIGPIMAKLGDLWEGGQIGVATEHLATNYLRQRLLMWMISGPPPEKSAPLVLACAPDEWHEGSLLIMGALLRRRRWPVAYLGQSVPLADLAAFVKDIKPAIVVLVAMTENSVSYLIDWPLYLPEIARSGKPIVGYSGRIFVEQPEWRLKMQGIFLGSTFEEGVQTIEKLAHPR
jgi:DNA-binding transcriptional MerR regulator